VLAAISKKNVFLGNFYVLPLFDDSGGDKLKFVE